MILMPRSHVSKRTAARSVSNHWKHQSVTWQSSLIRMGILSRFIGGRLDERGGGHVAIKMQVTTMTTAVDLDAYFQRIGYEGERTPTFETLQAIQLRHAKTIAFENLNPLMRWPVRLDIESLQQKLV